MPIDLIVLLGAGGHAKVVYDAALSGRLAERIEVRDDNPALQGAAFLNLRVVSPIGPLERLPGGLHIAIGDNAARAKLAAQVATSGKALVSIVHPHASVSGDAQVRQGVFLAAQAVVAPGVRVGECAIINHGAVVDHDCALGAHVHIAPNATLGGAVTVGEGALIGAGAVVLPGVAIGKWAVIGAGAVVTRPVADGETVYGVPATRKRDA
jgi:sugar O-acyltransferase (sialic acid O-acetyltransferase NeuD family)